MELQEKVNAWSDEKWWEGTQPEPFQESGLVKTSWLIEALPEMIFLADQLITIRVELLWLEEKLRVPEVSIVHYM